MLTFGVFSYVAGSVGARVDSNSGAYKVGELAAGLALTIASGGTDPAADAAVAAEAARMAGGGAAREGGAAPDLLTGRLGGERYPSEKLQTLGNYLGRRGITLEIDSPRLRPSTSGYFDATTGTLGLRSDATNYEVWHELWHFIQYRRLGKDAYLGQTRDTVAKLKGNEPEQFVFDRLENSRRWWNLTEDERGHARWYIEFAGGFR